MYVEDVIRNICFMPKTFFGLRDISLLSLLEESGYKEMKDQINSDLLKEFISKNVFLINIWKQLSEDQRCSPALVFEDKKVYYLNEKLEIENLITFEDTIEGCALYIQNYISKLYSLLIKLNN